MAAAFEKVLALASAGETFAGRVTWDGLRDRGVTPEGLERLQELQAALDGARFGGPMPEAADVLAAAETLVAAAGA